MTDKEKMIQFCNAIFSTKYEDIEKIEDNDINYIFHFIEGGEKTIRCISSEWFNHILDETNRILVENNTDELADYLNPRDYSLLTDDGESAIKVE